MLTYWLINDDGLDIKSISATRSTLSVIPVISNGTNLSVADEQSAGDAALNRPSSPIYRGGYSAELL